MNNSIEYSGLYWMNIFLNEYFGFCFELNFELNHFSARFNEKMNFSKCIAHPYSITCIRNHDLIWEKNSRDYQSQNLAYCTEGYKCPLFSNSDLSGRGQGRGKMQMIFMKCKCFSSLCSIRHKNGQYAHGAYFKYTIRQLRHSCSMFVGELKRPMLVCVCAKVFANPNVEEGIFKFSEEFSKF